VCRRFDLRDAVFSSHCRLSPYSKRRIRGRFSTRFPDETLFADACHDTKLFRWQVEECAAAGQKVAHKQNRLTHRAHDGVLTVLSGRGLFYAPRAKFIEDTTGIYWEYRSSNWNWDSKIPPNNRRTLVAPICGARNRLFRGVAGSGKSIMLALNVCQTLLSFAEEPASLFERRPPNRPHPRVLLQSITGPYLRQKIDDRFGRIAWSSLPQQMLTVTHFEGLVREIEAACLAMVTGLSYDKKLERAKSLCSRLDKLDASIRDPCFMMPCMWMKPGLNFPKSWNSYENSLARALTASRR